MKGSPHRIMKSNTIFRIEQSGIKERPRQEAISQFTLMGNLVSGHYNVQPGQHDDEQPGHWRAAWSHRLKALSQWWVACSGWKGGASSGWWTVCSGWSTASSGWWRWTWSQWWKAWPLWGARLWISLRTSRCWTYPASWWWTYWGRWSYTNRRCTSRSRLREHKNLTAVKGPKTRNQEIY